MKAIVRHRYGPPDVLTLEDVETPVPGPGDVIVGVRAAAVFIGDAKLVRGRPFVIRLATGLRRPREPIPGIDVAGVIEAIGPGVARVKPGDEVFGWSNGTLAQSIRAAEDHVAPKPARLTFEEAAATPEAAMTALQGLRDQGRVEAGQSVLVIGASGGVGSFAVQLGKAMGAEVTGICSTRNMGLVRSIGADEVIDYTRTDVGETGLRFDVIFQAAGTASPSRLRRSLTPTGTLVLSSGQGRWSGIDRIVEAVASRPFVRQRMAVFVTRENHADLMTIRELIEAGHIRPVIDRTYPLHQTAEAMRYVESGHTQGKVVIAV